MAYHQIAIKNVVLCWDNHTRQFTPHHKTHPCFSHERILPFRMATSHTTTSLSAITKLVLSVATPHADDPPILFRWEHHTQQLHLFRATNQLMFPKWQHHTRRLLSLSLSLSLSLHNRKTLCVSLSLHATSSFSVHHCSCDCHLTLRPQPEWFRLRLNPN